VFTTLQQLHQCLKSHFDAQNDPNARFIIQTDGAFTMAAGAKII
jgi:hypothetical protein